MPGDCHPMQLFPHEAARFRFVLTDCFRLVLRSSPLLFPHSHFRLPVLFARFRPRFPVSFSRFRPCILPLQPPCLRSIPPASPRSHFRSRRFLHTPHSARCFHFSDFPGKTIRLHLLSTQEEIPAQYRQRSVPHDPHKIYPAKLKKLFSPDIKLPHIPPIHSPAYRRTPSKFPNICTTNRRSA